MNKKKSIKEKRESNEGNFEEFEVSLKKIELSLEEMMDSYKRKREGELSFIKDTILNNSNRQSSRKMFETIKKINSLVEEVKLKPQKGRGKDFARVEVLLDKICSILLEK
jgi:hypothetical protein